MAREAIGWAGTGLSLLLGVALSLIGFVNLFWGNDPFFGLAIFAASGLYYLPITLKVKAHVASKRWRWVLGLLAVFIVWAALGVGELEDKVRLMHESFPMPNITGI